MRRSRTSFYTHWGMRILLIGLAGTLLAAVGNQAAKSDTPPTPAKTGKTSTKKKSQHPQMKRLRAASEKMLTPNSKFQGPHQQTMPSNAPKTPVLIIPTPAPQPTKTERFFQGAAKVMTTTWNSNIFVWLPAFSTDPNTGPKYGILPVLVLAENEHHHIRHLLAPSYTYNKILGNTFTHRYYFYPTDESQLYNTLSYSQHVNREVKLRYENSAFLGGRAYVRGEGFYDADGTLRFFGIGPGTNKGNEAGYTGHDKTIHGDMGVNFFQNCRFSLGLRYRRMGFDPTIVPGIKDLTTTFPSISQEEITTVVQEFHFLWDTRDFPITPSKGKSGEVFFEKTSRSWGSESDYIRYGLDGKRFFPWGDGSQNTALHVLFDKANGPNIPFYEMGTLGGRDTLRGFGDGRFYDKGRLSFTAEHRVALTSLSMMGVTTRFEVGPFYDVGTVFPSTEGLKLKYFQNVVGGAFRAVVKPNVVGSVDVGVGKEGVSTFVDINYPF
jgi:hypothetical protein